MAPTVKMEFREKKIQRVELTVNCVQQITHALPSMNL